MVKKLMYGVEPDIDLDQIVDNLANWDVGYSFITDKQNKLQKAFHVLRAAATSAEGSRSLVNKSFQYRVRRCQRYLRDVDILVGTLFGAAQLTSGLPGRGTEMNLVTWVNTREHVRNVCVRYGTILFMTDNSKLKGSTGKPFWVVRALPKCLARPLSVYLAYIRPFADSLHKLLAPQEAVKNAYLYISYHSSRKHFSTTDGSLLRGGSGGGGRGRSRSSGRGRGRGGGGRSSVSHHSDGEGETGKFVGVGNVMKPTRRIDCIDKTNTQSSRGCKGHKVLYTK
jgi:hypothetical protein